MTETKATKSRLVVRLDDKQNEELEKIKSLGFPTSSEILSTAIKAFVKASKEAA